MNEVSRLLSLQQLTTIPYRPYSKGPAERFHAMLKRVLLTMCAERPNDWDKYFSASLFAVREIPQESLGFSPFELLYGRNVRGPMQILRELWSVEETDEHARLTYQYVIDLRERLKKTCKLAQDNVRKLDIKQNVFMINTRGRVSLTSETKYFCYSRVRSIKFYFNGTAHMKF